LVLEYAFITGFTPIKTISISFARKGSIAEGSALKAFQSILAPILFSYTPFDWPISA